MTTQKLFQEIEKTFSFAVEDYNAMPKEKRLAYLEKIDHFIGSDVAKHEFTLLTQQIKHGLNYVAEDVAHVQRLRALLLFVDGLFERWKRLSTQYRDEVLPQQSQDPNRLI